MAGQSNYGVIIGPLRVNQNPDETARNMFRLLNCVGIRCMETTKISVNPEAGYCLVEFHQKQVEDHAIKVLREVQSIMNLYDLRRLTEKPELLKAERLSQLSDEIRQDLSSMSEAVLAEVKLPQETSYKQYMLVEDNNVILKHMSSVNDKVQLNDQYYGMVSLSANSDDSDTQINFHRLDEDNDDGDGPPASTSKKDPSNQDLATEALVKLDAKTSTPQISPCFHCGINFYVRYQQLESDYKNLQFFLGDTIKQKQREFRVTIGQHVCAFLNSEGGAIYFGVNKDRKIRGIIVTQKEEDSFRLDIDGQIKLVEPLVHTSAYKVHFINVMEQNGQIVSNLRVLGIEVLPAEKPSKLYRFKGYTYVWENNKVKEVK